MTWPCAGMGNRVRIWIPEWLEQSAETRLADLERRFEEIRRGNRRLHEQLDELKRLYVELYESVNGTVVDIESSLNRQLRVKKLKRGRRGQGGRLATNHPR